MWRDPPNCGLHNPADCATISTSYLRRCVLGIRFALNPLLSLPKQQGNLLTDHACHAASVTYESVSELVESIRSHPLDPLLKPIR